MNKKLLSIAVGTTFAASLSTGVAVAAENPFGMSELNSGYQLSMSDSEGLCGGKSKEGKCGDKAKEGKCGDKAKEGKCGDKAKKDKAKEGKCASEGKCGGAS